MNPAFKSFDNLLRNIANKIIQARQQKKLVSLVCEKANRQNLGTIDFRGYDAVKLLPLRWCISSQQLFNRLLIEQVKPYSNLLDEIDNLLQQATHELAILIQENKAPADQEYLITASNAIYMNSPLISNDRNELFYSIKQVAPAEAEQLYNTIYIKSSVLISYKRPIGQVASDDDETATLMCDQMQEEIEYSSCASPAVSAKKQRLGLD